jgi:hypothetical protein
MTDDELVAAFETADLPAGCFAHEQHVRVAWWYVRRYPIGIAIERFSTGIQRLATAHGHPERYHATITVAYVLLIHERVNRTPDAAWQQFTSANADLLGWNPSILDKYYRHETLWSETARQGFVMPDLCP